MDGEGERGRGTAMGAMGVGAVIVVVGDEGTGRRVGGMGVINGTGCFRGRPRGRLTDDGDAEAIVVISCIGTSTSSTLTDTDTIA